MEPGSVVGEKGEKKTMNDRFASLAFFFFCRFTAFFPFFPTAEPSLRLRVSTIVSPCCLKPSRVPCWGKLK